MVAEKNGAVELKAAKSSTQQQQHKRKIRNERNIYLTSFKENKIYTKEFSISTKHFELHVNRNDDSVADFFRYSNQTVGRDSSFNGALDTTQPSD